MGDAKRRQLKDPDYGQYYQLNSIPDISRHLERLSKKYRLQYEQLKDGKRLREFMETGEDRGRTIEEISQFLIGDWLSQQLSVYSETDRILLAALLYQIWIPTEPVDVAKFWREDHAFGAMQCQIIAFLPWLAQINQAVIQKADTMSQPIAAYLPSIYQDTLDWLEKIQSAEEAVNNQLENIR